METAVDAKYFDRICEFGSFFASQHINPINGKEQKEKFLSGEIDNPHFQYSNTLDYNLHETELRLLIKDMIHDEADYFLQEVYIAKIEEQLQILNMIEACKDGHDYIFSNLSRKIYGAPSMKATRVTMNYVAKIIDQALKSNDPAKENAAKELVVNLHGLLLYAKSNVEIPGNLNFNLETKHEDADIDAEMIKFHFDSELYSRKINGWECLIVDKDNKSIQINQTEKKVLIPRERKVSSDYLAKLIASQISTHVTRRENGEKSPLLLLGLGLAGYLQAEEGLAIMQEQKVTKGFFNQDAIMLHFASILAESMDGQKRYFRNVFNVIRKTAILINAKNPDNYAWTKTMRIFRGTTGQTANAYHRGDLAYIEGNTKLWQLVKEYPESEQHFFLGKYDPTNEIHREVIKCFCGVKII